MVAVVEVRLSDVPIVNAAVVCPAAIVTVAGTVTPELLLVSAIMTPPAAAGPFNTTVAMPERPAEMVAGTFSPATPNAGVSEIVVLAPHPLTRAVMVADVGETTGRVVTV